MRLGPKIDYWPARPVAIDAVLAADGPITAGALGAPAKGFSAVEYLLWGRGGDTVAALAAEPRRCEYLGVVIADLGAQVRALAAVWDPTGGDFLGELTEAGERPTRYPTLQAAFGEVVNRVGYLIENIRTNKLGKPLGVVSGGGPQPDGVESPFSGRSLADLRANLVGVRRVLLGDGAEELGLDGYLRRRGRYLAPLVTARLDAAEAALDALGATGLTLAQAVQTEPAPVQALLDRLGELQRAVQVDVIGALALTVGFNDADAD